MLEFIGFLTSFGFLVSIGGTILFFLKGNHNWQKWLWSAVVCLLLFLATAFFGLPLIS